MANKRIRLDYVIKNTKESLTIQSEKELKKRFNADTLQFIREDGDQTSLHSGEGVLEISELIKYLTDLKANNYSHVSLELDSTYDSYEIYGYKFSEIRELEIVTVWYSVQNGGDGSAYPAWFLTEKDANYDQETMDEGWGEYCTGCVETFVGSDIHEAALENSN